MSGELLGVRLGGHQLFDDLGIDHRSPLGNRPDRPDELGTLVNTLLQEVRAAIRPVLEERERIARMAVLAQHHHAGLRVRFTQDRRRAYPLVRLRGRHADVGQDHVRLVAFDGLEERVEIAA